MNVLNNIESIRKEFPVAIVVSELWEFPLEASRSLYELDESTIS